ncbi:MAG: hypothetical protein V3S71_05630 [Acidobacteriota bacterium]
MRHVLTTATILLVLLPLAVSACREDSPESRLRAALSRGETAVEAGDLATLKGLISEEYADGSGRDRRAVLGLLRYHFLRHDTIHLLRRVREITFPEPGSARASLFVAMAGEPILGAEDLPRLQADLHRFDLMLREEAGAWRVTRADWRRAAASDFF